MWHQSLLMSINKRLKIPKRSQSKNDRQSNGQEKRGKQRYAKNYTEN